MPHFIIEYSANLDDKIDMDALMLALRDAIMAAEVFPLSGTKIRTQRHDTYLVADGHPDNAFLHVQGRILPGRTMEAKENASNLIFKAMTDILDPLFDQLPFGLSLDIQEMSEELNRKKKNIPEPPRD
ncbi:MAG: 5-carboxymethyl-2-hydroxymuconate isomerase [Kordiimonas sp.]|nr:5-carboxymethyl-2-hydroxymuconate isomerase [Kordiimonas sp.]|tara:strand:- start:4475 stop:4858 length:384 start_codon:yes stop_codon:yes gene_type:complete